MRAQEVVRRYATTLLSAASESQIGEEEMRRDLEGLAATLRASPDLVAFVHNRLIEPGVRRSGLEAVFAGKVQPLTLNFLRLLAARRRAALLPEIAQACLDLLDSRSGVATAQVTSAVELSHQQSESLRSRLAAYTGRQIRLEAKVDGSIRGGLVARVGDLVFDGSVGTQLERLRLQLMGAHQ